MNEAPEGDNDGDDSSSYQSMPNQFKSALDEFRERWQQEIKTDSTKNADRPTQGVNTTADEVDAEMRATRLFQQGVEYEKAGKVFEALRYYRQAEKIVPGIEIRIYKPGFGQIIKQPQNAEDKVDSQTEESKPELEEDLSSVDLYERFQTALHGHSLISRATPPRTVSTQTHISDLPMELILYILRWVVSAHLDVLSLEQCAATCKGLYICARDEEIWKQLCLKVCGLLTPTEKGKHSSWRQMYIDRQRIRFNGCYMSKTSYLRYGENSFQDQFYRPVQIIDYYRFMRFFPNGSVIMVTSAEEPAHTVGKLKNVNQLREALKGSYRIRGDLVIIMLNPPEVHTKRKACSTDGEGAKKHTFYMELRIASTSKRRSCQLQWVRYSIIQIKNKLEISSEFELSATKYPPLWFSRVKSYHMEADAPLD